MSEEFGQFLEAQHLEFSRRRGRVASAAEFAKYLGVSPVSLSQWMQGTREPAGNNVHMIAAKLGPRVYEILHLPSAMPEDPLFQHVAKLWFVVPEKFRLQVIKLLEEGAEGTETDQNANTQAP